MKIARSVERFVLAGIAGTAVIGASFYEPIKTWLSKTEPTMAPFFSVGAFTFLYSLFLWLYDSWFWNLFHRAHSLNGYWGYILNNEHSGRTLCGAFVIVQDSYDIEIRYGQAHTVATQVKSLGNERVRWNSVSASYDGGRLTILYEFQITDTVSDPAFQRGAKYRGFMELITSDQPPRDLAGPYRDFPPCELNSGHVRAVKIKRRWWNFIPFKGITMAEAIKRTFDHYKKELKT
jgi:hypothetical protein